LHVSQKALFWISIAHFGPKMHVIDETLSFALFYNALFAAKKRDIDLISGDL
jgi:hypothetical protein